MMTEQRTKQVDRSSFIKKIMFFAGLFLAASVFTYFMDLEPSGRSVDSPPRPSPLKVNPKDLDFGLAMSQTDFSWTLPLTNRSSHSVSIEDIKSSCACTSVEPRSLSIAPGGTEKINLTLDLTPRDAKAAKVPTRRFSAQLLPIIKGGKFRNIVWELRGRVSNALMATPASVFCGQNLVHGIPLPTKTVQLESRQPLISLVAVCDASVASVGVTRLDPRRFDIALTPSEKLPVGPFDFSFVLNATTSVGEPLPPMNIKVHGTIYPDIQAFPNELALGQQFLKRRVVAHITVASARREAFVVKGVQFASDVTTVEPKSSGIAIEHRFAMTIEPKHVGEQESLVDFTVHKPGSEIQHVTVPVRYYVLDESKVLHLPIASLPHH